jgi:hypothetical protein
MAVLAVSLFSRVVGKKGELLGSASSSREAPPPMDRVSNAGVHPGVPPWHPGKELKEENDFEFSKRVPPLSAMIASRPPSSQERINALYDFLGDFP